MCLEHWAPCTQCCEHTALGQHRALQPNSASLLMAWLGAQCGSCCGMGMTDAMAEDMSLGMPNSQDAEKGWAPASTELTPEVIVMGPEAEVERAAPVSELSQR